MPKIISVGTAVPDYVITQTEAKDFTKKLFGTYFKDIDRLLKIFDNTLIKKRHFCVPLDWFDSEHSFAEKNEIYTINAFSLAKKAILSALANSPFTYEDINHIFFVSSTGISTPSIDAYLFNDPELNFSKNIKRTPIWGLGCAGGAAGLSRAFEYTLAFPKEKVLVIALEIGELAFLKNDFSKSNLVATSLFGDGAAAVLVIGDHANKKTPFPAVEIIDTKSFILNNSLDVMGWEVINEGFKVIFSKNIPSLIKKEIKPEIEQFLMENQLTTEQINFFVLHPGGAKVINTYQEIFNLTEEKLNSTRKILNEYGNMSSPTVLFVLKDTIEKNNINKGYGLLLSLGPGFSSEMLLLKMG